MEIGMYTLARRLREEFGASHVSVSLSENPGGHVVRHPMIFQTLNECEEGTLYIIPSSQLPRTPKRRGSRIGPVSLLVVGDPFDDCMSDSSFDIIWVDDESSFVQVFNSTVAIFDELWSWDCLLRNLVDTGATASELIEKSLPIIKNDIWLIDIDQLVIAHHRYGKTSNESSASSIEVGDHASITDKSVSDQPDDIDNCFNPYFGILAIHSGSRYIAKQLPLPDDYGATLYFEESSRHVDEADFCLISILAQRITASYNCIDKKEMPQKAFSETPTLKRLIQGKDINVHGVNRALERIDWVNGSDAFLCICVDYQLSVHASTGFFAKSLDYLRSTIQDRFACVSFRFNHSVVAIVNLTKSDLTGEQFKTELRQIVVDIKCVAGVSDSFTEMMELKGYYRQAQAALDLGERFSREDVFSFRDLIVEFCVNQVLNDIQPAHLIDPGIFKLLHHDEEHGSDLFQTLDTFMRCNCSIAKACTLLYMRRNSLTYRLNKIRSIAGIDFDSPEDRLLVMLYLKILEIYGQ